MTTMMRWDPFQDLRSAREMAQMSPRLAHALGLHARQQGNDRAMTTAWAPALDISERKDAYLVTVEVPGVEPEDLDITMEDGLLTIKGERQFTSESSSSSSSTGSSAATAPPTVDHPARPGPGRPHRGHLRQRGAADRGPQG